MNIGVRGCERGDKKVKEKGGATFWQRDSIYGSKKHPSENGKGGW